MPRTATLERMAYDQASNAALLAALTLRCQGQFQYFVLSGDTRRSVVDDAIMRAQPPVMVIALNVKRQTTLVPNLHAPGIVTIGWTAVYPDKMSVGGPIGGPPGPTPVRRPFAMYAACDPNLATLGQGLVLQAAQEWFDSRDMRYSARWDAVPKPNFTWAPLFPGGPLALVR
jgi:hypothetical protein